MSARALDILALLAGRSGEVVEKKELMALVWPDVTVDEGSLRFHMNGLRKALGDGKDGARYIATIPGRGYCFVAPVLPAETGAAPAEPSTQSGDRPVLPPRLARMVGRAEAEEEIARSLGSNRFVTILGPGGIGKTTVAVSVGHRLVPDFAGGVKFVDLGSTSDPALVPSMVASATGFVAHAADLVPSLIAFLREKRLLIILDSCEHVVDAVARLAERIFTENPEVHILATSREALRVEGERVHPLPPLGSPPSHSDLAPDQVLSFPAVQLFVERVTSSGVPFELTDADAPAVAEICRNLDGIPLAIELAAGRVNAYGVEGIAALLGDRFGQLANSRRTAVARHHTLSAALDWSYDLLAEPERTLLRRLSVFVGPFTLDAAQATAAFGELGELAALEGVGTLVSKSLIAADLAGAAPRYRLLDTTRGYARDKLIESGEARQVARRHALYYLGALEQEGEPAGAAEPRCYLGNIRAALEWCFGEKGDPEVGTALAAAAAPLLVELSLLSECCGWAKRGIAALSASTRGTVREINLQAALGHSLMFTEGNSERVRECFTRGVTLARELREPFMELRLLGSLHLFNERMGNYHGAVEFAERSVVIARSIGHPAALAAAGSFLGLSQHLVGNHLAARQLLEGALAQQAASPQARTIQFGFDYRNRSRITLARHHWLVGEADQAAALADRTIADAAGMRHPVTLCIALIWGITVSLWIGDASGSDEKIETFLAHAEKHSLNPYSAVGCGYRGELCVQRGESEAGVALLERALETLHAARYELVTTSFMISLAQGLDKMGRHPAALETIDRALELVQANGDLLYMPEVLRTKGAILAGAGPANAGAAADCFRQSLDWARRQSALAWELRTATSYAALLARQGSREEAVERLAPIYSRFTEGLETADPRAARALLDLLAPGGTAAAAVRPLPRRGNDAPAA
ncbi:MAG TPA: winged helix-turn-helix domain-containing protein [Allosphingosinicella sp.]